MKRPEEEISLPTHETNFQTGVFRELGSFLRTPRCRPWRYKLPMELSAHTHDRARDRAREIVEFWRNRRWLTSGSAPLHVHPLDLVKLEELIASALNTDS